MIIPIVLGVASVLLLWRYLRKPDDPMDIVSKVELSELDPRDVDYLSDLSEDTQLRSDEAPRSPHAKGHPTPSIRKFSDNFSCFSDAEPYIIRKEPDEDSLSSSSWKEHNM